ncbi:MULTISPECIES: three-helix bundle dimerization domain-containing protein [unclassified Streptomyces]|uniref:arsenate-mycothiol transferase ArsC n=1 Tax=unclassified Streptomyces TaxID=2593676 RepID=UPI002E0DDC49|nr:MULTISPECIES: hypothetical protein [unclassified Streptomyces]
MSTSSSPLPPDERLAAGAARLASRYAGHIGPETVLGLLADSYAKLAEQARIRTHLIVLAERLTAERLHALAHTQGIAGAGRSRVLFVCSHNAGRSQMAAALLAHRAGDAVTVSSGGTHPTEDVEPFVAQALTEAGVDIRRLPQALDRGSCPGRRRRHHDGLRGRLPRRARPPLPRLARS